MHKKGLVTTIIPTYKRSDSLNRAIDSVLNQTYKNIEIVVVDDNDNESVYRTETEKLMVQYNNDSRIKYLKHPYNMNGAQARNTGIRHARGEFITFLDDDDEFSSKRFEKLIPVLDSSPKEFGLISSSCIYFKDNMLYKKRKIKFTDDVILELLSDQFKIGSGSNFIIKREVIEEVEGFDINFLRHQDFEFLVRVAMKYKFLSSDEYLLNIYLDSEQNNSQSIEKLLETKKQYLTKYQKLAENRGWDKILNSQLRSIVFEIYINNREKEFEKIIELYKDNSSLKEFISIKFRSKTYRLIRQSYRAIKP